MKVPPPLRTIPLMGALSGPPSRSPAPGTGSTPLGVFAAAPPPLNRTLGRLGTGSWMRLAIERTSALLAGEQEARSSRQQQRRKQADAAADASAEEPPVSAEKAAGLPTPEVEVGDALPPQQERKIPKNGKRSRAEEDGASPTESPSEMHQADPPSSEGPKGGPQEPPAFQGPRAERHRGPAKNSSKRSRKKDGVGAPSVSFEGPRGIHETPPEATASPIESAQQEQQQQQPSEAAHSENSIEDPSSIKGPATGDPEGAPSKKPRRSKKGPQGPSAEEEGGHPPSKETQKAPSKSINTSAPRAEEESHRGLPRDGRQEDPAPSESPSGDFSFVVDLIGGLAVPAPATPAAAAPAMSKEQQRQKEGQESREKGPRGPHRRKTESERKSQSSRGAPKDQELRGASKAANEPKTTCPTLPQQQQQQQHEEERRERRRERQKRRRRSDGEDRRRISREAAVESSPLEAPSLSSLGAPPLVDASAGSEKSAPPQESPGTSVGVQAGVASCPFFPSVWGADFAAAREKETTAEKRKLLRLLGAPEGPPSAGDSPSGAPTTDPATTEGGALRHLWPSAALAAWEPASKEVHAGGIEDSLCDSGGLSSSSGSPCSVASPLRGPQRAPTGGRAFRPLYVSFGGTARRSLFAASRQSPSAASPRATNEADSPQGSEGPQGGPSGDAARLIRALRRTHRRLVLGGQSAVLRSDSSSEEEASSREPSPPPAAAVSAPEPAAAAALAVAPVAAVVAAPPRGLGGQGCIGGPSEAPALPGGPLLLKATPAIAAPAATAIPGQRSRRPRCSAPPAVGLRGGLWGLPTDSSGSEGEGRLKVLCQGGGTSSSSSSSSSITGEWAAGASSFPQGLTKPSSPRTYRKAPLGPLEDVAAATPAVRCGATRGGPPAGEEANDTPTPLLLEAPTISYPRGPPGSPLKQQHQGEQGVGRLETSPVSARTRGLLPEATEGASSALDSGAPPYAKTGAPAWEQSPLVNLLASPAGGGGPSEEVALGGLSLEGSPIGRPLGEGTEGGAPQREGPFFASDKEDGGQEAEGTREGAPGSVAPALEGPPDQWEGLAIEGEEMVLSDGCGAEGTDWGSPQPPSSRVSPFVVSIGDSEADSLPQSTCSPLLLSLQKQQQTQQEEVGVPENNENLPLPHQHQHHQQQGERSHQKDSLSFIRSPREPLSPETEEETARATSVTAARDAPALWFKNLGDLGLEGHRPATEPRVSRCGVLSPEEAEEAQRLLDDPEEEVPPKVRYGIPLCRGQGLRHASVCFCPRRTLAAVGRADLLDDEAVNLYFGLLQERNNRALLAREKVPRCLLLPSHFYSSLAANGFIAVRRWTLRGKIDVFSYDLLLLPVHVLDRAHWALGCVMLKQRTILYIDSLRSDDDAIKFFALVRRYLLAEHLDKKGIPFSPASSWRGLIPHGVPQQSNAVDCGVFCCSLAECLADGRPLPSSLPPETIEKIRLHMVLQLHRGVVD